MKTKSFRRLAVLEIVLATGLIAINNLAANIFAAVLLADSLSVLFLLRGRQ